MRQGGPIPPAPTEGDVGVTLSEVIGFITEFNANVAIFEPLAALVLLGLMSIEKTKTAVVANERRSVANARGISINSAEIQELFRRLNSINSNATDAHVERLIGPNGQGLSSDIVGTN